MLFHSSREEAFIQLRRMARGMCRACCCCCELPLHLTSSLNMTILGLNPKPLTVLLLLNKAARLLGYLRIGDRRLMPAHAVFPQAYVRETGAYKRVLLLLNKADLLPVEVKQAHVPCQ